MNPLKNLLKLEPVSKPNYSLKYVLDFATNLGLENKKNTSSQEIESSIQFLNLLKELLDFLEDYQKKIMELSKFNQHLEIVMSNKESLLMRLKDPYVGDHINIATSISTLSNNLENIKWFDEKDNLIDDQMNNTVFAHSTMSSSSRKAYVVGVGLTKFIKPGSAIDYPVKALLDAGIIYDDIQQAYVGYIYGDSTCGQRALYQLGMTQIPIMAIESGSIDCALALGFEKMKPGPMNSIFKDRTFPIVEVSSSIKDLDNSPLMAQLFGNAGIEYCNKYNATYDHMAKISEKNHLHSSKNPYSQYNKIYTLEQIKSSPKIYGPLTNLQCCPTSDGSATVILASETFIKKNKLENQSIEIVDQILSTDSPSLLDTKSFMDLVGFNMTKIAAMKIYERSGVYPNDIQLITYDALGLCKPGESHKLIESGDTTYGGKYVINPSGGLLSKGHPVGATGLAQCIELVWQLREWATNRQVSNIKYALQHNLGLGGAVVISIYKKPKFFSLNNNVDGRKRLGYNPAIESKGITTNDLDKVKSKSDYSNWFYSKL
ncbi:1561_t:CDS:10 [Entrophospora sp. SA101]|nr:1561_t:CDS:10 [Entrophospora sp. SA101]